MWFGVNFGVFVIIFKFCYIYVCDFEVLGKVVLWKLGWLSFSFYGERGLCFLNFVCNC